MQDWDLDEVDPASLGKDVPSSTAQELLSGQELPCISHRDTSLPSAMMKECQDCQEPLLSQGPGVFFCPPCLGLQLACSSTTGSGVQSTAACREPKEESHSDGQFLPGYTSSSATAKKVSGGHGSVKKGKHATGREDENVSRACLFCRCFVLTIITLIYCFVQVHDRG